MDNDLNSKKISFSVLMANYNNAKYIETAIKSIISQTYPIWELIIVDDDSTDDSKDKIKPFLNNKQIHLIQHKRNIGYGGTLKTAAKNATNEILGILDADDKLHLDALKIMAEAYQNNQNCGFIYSTMWSCDSELKNCKINNWIGPVIPEKTNIFKSKISHFKTFRKEIYEKTVGFEESQKKIVDKDIIYKLEEVTKFKFINKPLYYYRHHESGISQGKDKYSLRVYHYIAKLKTYRRRLNTNLPNLSKRALYLEYLELTFYSFIHSLKYLYTRFNINKMVKLVSNLIPIIIKNRFEFFKKRIVDIYYQQVAHN